MNRHLKTLLFCAGCLLLTGCSSVRTIRADYNGQTIRESWHKVAGITMNHSVSRE